MSFTRSSNSGDLGFNAPGSQGVRLSPSHLAPMEAVMVDRSQLPTTPLEDWGFEALATRDPKIQLPELTLNADLSTRTDLDFLDDNGRKVGGLVFDEPDQTGWWEGVHANQRLLVFVGDVHALLKATTLEQQRLVLVGAHIGLSSLAIRGYSNGVGTAAPGQ